MKVRELMAHLAQADPDAVVLLFPQHADSTDGAELKEIIVPESSWVHEVGEGGELEVFYPAEPRKDENRGPMRTTRERVVLLGEELGNYRYWSCWPDV
ncbi:hypothetical protein H3V53_03440 [Paraburkholderia bengalensis]|uniref:Uncharacterized protein n=1 Tax=Paraburkholderia bengalensis TaxID=2747562 RepID=A0ABU8ILG5_9BURK